MGRDDAAGLEQTVLLCYGKDSWTNRKYSGVGRLYVQTDKHLKYKLSMFLKEGYAAG